MNMIRITPEDEIFPEELRNINSSPRELYCIGNLNLFKNRKVAIVGSRKCTAYGKAVSQNLCRKLSASGITVVSGLARGIDRQAHIGALNGAGSTIAVMATGIDKCYPISNMDLYNKIGKEGLIISENPPGYMCRKYDFPHRNRLISGLSEGIVVVEAPLRSGSLITAEKGAEQGRDVFAVPGNITSFFSMGCNSLIRDGAKAVSVLNDIFRDLNIEIPQEVVDVKNLGKDEKIVYDIIERKGESTAEYLYKSTGFEQPKLSGILTVLEMKGVITSSMGKFFVEKI